MLENNYISDTNASATRLHICWLIKKMGIEGKIQETRK